MTFEHRHENKSCSACRDRVNERVKVAKVVKVKVFQVIKTFLVPSFCLTFRHFFKIKIIKFLKFIFSPCQAALSELPHPTWWRGSQHLLHCNRRLSRTRHDSLMGPIVSQNYHFLGLLKTSLTLGWNCNSPMMGMCITFFKTEYVMNCSFLQVICLVGTE